MEKQPTDPPAPPPPAAAPAAPGAGGYGGSNGQPGVVAGGSSSSSGGGAGGAPQAVQPPELPDAGAAAAAGATPTGQALHTIRTLLADSPLTTEALDQLRRVVNGVVWLGPAAVIAARQVLLQAYLNPAMVVTDKTTRMLLQVLVQLLRSCPEPDNHLPMIDTLASFDLPGAPTDYTTNEAQKTLLLAKAFFKSTQYAQTADLDRAAVLPHVLRIVLRSFSALQAGDNPDLWHWVGFVACRIAFYFSRDKANSQSFSSHLPGVLQFIALPQFNPPANAAAQRHLASLTALVNRVAWLEVNVWRNGQPVIPTMMNVAQSLQSLLGNADVEAVPQWLKYRDRTILDCLGTLNSYMDTTKPSEWKALVPKIITLLLKVFVLSPQDMRHFRTNNPAFFESFLMFGMQSMATHTLQIIAHRSSSLAASVLQVTEQLALQAVNAGNRSQLFACIAVLGATSGSMSASALEAQVNFARTHLLPILSNTASRHVEADFASEFPVAVLQWITLSCGHIFARFAADSVSSIVALLDHPNCRLGAMAAECLTTFVRRAPKAAMAPMIQTAVYAAIHANEVAPMDAFSYFVSEAAVKFSSQLSPEALVPALIQSITVQIGGLALTSDAALSDEKQEEDEEEKLMSLSGTLSALITAAHDAASPAFNTQLFELAHRLVSSLDFFGEALQLAALVIDSNHVAGNTAFDPWPFLMHACAQDGGSDFFMELYPAMALALTHFPTGLNVEAAAALFTFFTKVDDSQMQLARNIIVCPAVAGRLEFQPIITTFAAFVCGLDETFHRKPDLMAALICAFPAVVQWHPMIAPMFAALVDRIVSRPSHRLFKMALVAIATLLRVPSSQDSWPRLRSVGQQLVTAMPPPPQYHSDEEADGFAGLGSDSSDDDNDDDDDENDDDEQDEDEQGEDWDPDGDDGDEPDVPQSEDDSAQSADDDDAGLVAGDAPQLASCVDTIDAIAAFNSV